MRACAEHWCQLKLNDVILRVLLYESCETVGSVSVVNFYDKIMVSVNALTCLLQLVCLKQPDDVLPIRSTDFLWLPLCSALLLFATGGTC